MRLAAASCLAAVCFAAAPAAARGSVRGDGNVTTEPREVAPFDRLSLRGSLGAVVKVGPAQAVSVVIDANLQQHVRTRLEGSTLVVDSDVELHPTRGARVIVTIPALRALETNGSGEALVDGGAGDLGLATSGSGEIRWRGEAGRLEVTTSGSGEIVLAGKADVLVARTNGTGDVLARELTVREADVRTSGSGDAEVTLAAGVLRARTSGSGDVTWFGEGRVEEARASGSGEITQGR